MPIVSRFRALTPNDRFGCIALVLGALGLCVSVWVEGTAPMRIFTLGLLFFGQVCAAQVAGFEKPLTKLVLVALSFAVVGFVVFELEGTVKAGLLFAFAGFFSVLFWSFAMLHRPGRAQVAGKLGAMAGGLSLLVLIGGHIFVGLGAALGLSVLRSAGTASASEVMELVRVASICLGVWSAVSAWMIFRGVLDGEEQAESK